MAVANVQYNDDAMVAAYALVQMGDDSTGGDWVDVGDNDATHNNNNGEISGNENRGGNEIENENWGENDNENRDENGRIADGGEHEGEIEGDHESDIEDEIEIGNPNPPRFKCDFCGRAIRKRAHLVTHIRTHTKEKPFECQECDRKFARNDVLTRHVNTVHRRLRPHICPRCDKSFGRKDHLDKHMDIHTTVILIEPTNE